MKNLIYITALSFILCSCSGQTKKEEKKSVDSKKDEWISLFDGKTTNGWHYYNDNGNKFGWSVSDGVLSFDPTLGKYQRDSLGNILKHGNGSLKKENNKTYD